MAGTFEAVIGLEVHVQLLTRTKIFCRCPNRFGAEPNTLVCPFCLGYPGTLPVLNRRAVDLAVRLAVALGAEVHRRSTFARKNYFYPDLPKGYQISQFERPLATGGALPLSRAGKRVRIRRLHLEEDAGKLLHEAPGGGALPGQSLVDFNRAGVPLVEIVTEPDLATSGDAADFLESLRLLLLYTGTSDASMEEGSLRCDANVSLRPPGEDRPGTKCEVKNLNSFRHVRGALDYEIERQGRRLRAGRKVVPETRSWDGAATRPLRSKEEAHDYRYFPEPDLPPLAVAEERIARLAGKLPELPWQRRQRLAEAHGLAAADAAVLTSSRPLADYFEAAVAASAGSPRTIANWIRTELLRELKERRARPSEAPPPEHLAALVALVDGGALSNRAAKQVFAAIWESGEEPAAAVERLGLAQVRDRSRIDAWVGEVLAAHRDQAAAYRAGKRQLFGYFIGQVMERSGGRAEPARVRESLRRALEGSGPGTVR